MLKSTDQGAAAKLNQIVSETLRRATETECTWACEVVKSGGQVTVTVTTEAADETPQA